ncbi:Speckle-type POZ protein [Strongyloides ratti]|uniref:Speckle-type POZ protein n=1 Tax=Strongyloides ratti TaxID=34506 RepID=A0A090KXS7_STRRB|nr:Speckle-type POZ protein [Strongyloides ratti]CEF62186.1 Speckle-type POZ protein [Strongyloides ratti]
MNEENNQILTSSPSPKPPPLKRKKISGYDNECCTNFEYIKVSQKWSINNFGLLFDIGDEDLILKSSVFKSPDAPDICWQLQFNPHGHRGHSYEDFNTVRLFLNVITTSPGRELNLKVRCKIFFNRNGSYGGYYNVNSHSFHSLNTSRSQSTCLASLSRSTIHGCIRDDQSILIMVEIEFLLNPEEVLCQEVVSNFNRELTPIDRKYFDRFFEMYESKDLTDCKILCKGQEFPVHKFMLASQSSVFRAMFKHTDTKEAINNSIIIEDSTPGAVSEMLKYLYSGEVVKELEVEEGIQLLRLAEKYILGQLKIICEEKLSAKVSNENVCRLIEEADIYNAENLMDACMQKISKFHKIILKMDEWSELKMARPILANSVLECIISGEPSPIKDEAAEY